MTTIEIADDLFIDPYNVSVFSLTLNTNISVKTADEVEDMKPELNELVRHTLLGDREAVGIVFGRPPVVVKVRATKAGIEVGKKQKRVHIHMNVEVQHNARSYSMQALCRRLTLWLNDNYTRSNGWYVHGEIQDKRRDNYANKELREVRNEQMDNEEPDEVERLSTVLETLQV